MIPWPISCMREREQNVDITDFSDLTILNSCVCQSIRDMCKDAREMSDS